MGYVSRQVRIYHGTMVSSGTAFQSISIGNTHDFVNIAGRGALRYLAFLVNSGVDSHKMWPKITVDGVVVREHETLQALDSRGFDVHTLPLKLTKYAVDGLCHCLYAFNPELMFERTLKLSAMNGSATDAISVKGSWIYAKEPI